MPNLLQHVSEFDSVVEAQPPAGSPTYTDLSRIRRSIQAIAGASSNPAPPLTETIALAAQSCPSEARRTLASVLIRLVSSATLLTESETRHCRRDIVAFVERTCPDLTKELYRKTDQNHVKLESIKRIHVTACDQLEPLLQPFASLHDLAKRRQTIMRSINHSKAKSYLNAFGYNTVRPLVESLLAQVEDLVRSQGHSLQTTMDRLVQDLPLQLEQCKTVGTFLTAKYAVPFLERLQASAVAMQEQLIEDFACRISVPDSAQRLEKRYPLHQVASTLEISVALHNDGPGAAQSVTTYCVSDHAEVKNPETILGTIEPGPFVVTMQIELTSPQELVQVDIEVMWSVVGDPQPHRENFTTLIRGQREDIDWDELDLRQPYSLEVAYDDDFYGRKDVVNRIVRRITSDAMQSCYISGQKRVGKSSLAKAIQSKLESFQGSARYRVLYLECGEIMHSKGEQTLAELGRRLEEHFSYHLKRSTRWESKDYSSSLSPLNRLLDTLAAEEPLDRFLVVLDEFDEINESLYSHGELANTFFLNLRTLASKRNVAFVLVGAEKMPHVMSSQGERLNKFDRESLDSFDRATEWSDFASLVRDPVSSSIVFHDHALRKLYDLTDGHPYFAKVLCAQVYESALAAKDAEISDVDVERAGQRLLVSLGTNAFAHYWRDGTRGGPSEVEIASVRRCRTLVSWARTIRSRARPTRDEIEQHLYAGLPADEMGLELDDFCRRGVFREDAGEYSPTVELFGRWLWNGGFLRLVDGQLGDELEERRGRDEDEAFVRSDEVVELVDRWPLYQGRRLTEDAVRAWIEQIETNVERRQLFKLLQNVRFVSDDELREGFESAYANIRRRLPVFVQRKRSERRRDVLVTFLGQTSKSGTHYASQFAKANRIDHANVVASDRIRTRLGLTDGDGVSAVVIVDDMIGTGNTLIGEFDSQVRALHDLGVGSRIPLFVCVFCATSVGERKVRRYLDRTFEDSDIEVHEVLDNQHFAFHDGLGFWDSDWEKQKAKSMILDLGAQVDKRRPLGYRGQGLLLAFSRNCPNNSLPILFGHGKGASDWKPLFPRV